MRKLSLKLKAVMNVNIEYSDFSTVLASDYSTQEGNNWSKPYLLRPGIWHGRRPTLHLFHVIKLKPIRKLETHRIFCSMQQQVHEKSRLYLWPPHFPAENKADSDKQNFSFYQNFQKQLCKQNCTTLVLTTIRTS